MTRQMVVVLKTLCEAVLIFLLLFSQVRNVTQETADVFLEYVQRNIPEGVSMKVEQTELESISDYFVLPPEAQEFLEQQKSNQEKRE